MPRCVCVGAFFVVSKLESKICRPDFDLLNVFKDKLYGHWGITELKVAREGLVQGFFCRSRGVARISVCFAAVVLLGLAACAPVVKSSGDPLGTIGFDADRFETADGTVLPLQTWLPDHPVAVVLGLHGFGDYANAFADTAKVLKSVGVAFYAYDQRGFGRTSTRGFWPGTRTLVGDASDMLIALRHRYPGLPVYLMGESMGGAVAILTATARPQLIDGVILAAPAVWSRDQMRWYETGPLTVLSHSLPWLPVSGRGLDIWPSDNIEMLRKLAKDPNMMKSVRVDMIAGIADLMDQARSRAKDLTVPSLVISGKQDQVIPPGSVDAFVRDMPADAPATVCLYPRGYHMVLRDLEAATVRRDVANWIIGKNKEISTACHAR